jgi:hypothetical protein
VTEPEPQPALASESVEAELQIYRWFGASWPFRTEARAVHGIEFL